MSRATDLRDAIQAELQKHRAERVVTFYTPNFPTEWLVDGPVIGVRVSGRDVQSLQGPDMRKVILEVAVFGVITPSDEASTDPVINHQAMVAAGDKFDTLQEELIDLWTPETSDGTPAPLARIGLADHSFQEITQPVPFDAAAFYEFSNWASVFLVTYLDTRDS